MLSSPIVVLIPPSMQMTDEQFFEFCQVNRDLRIERNKLGEISIMPPTGSETGNRNFNIALQVGIWSEQDGTGICFDSSTGFKLSTGADRSEQGSLPERKAGQQGALRDRILPGFVLNTSKVW